MNAKLKHLRPAATCEWETPPQLFRHIEATLAPNTGCDLDVCATAQNAKCKRFFTKEDDGLAQPWECECAWMNPPYGREIERWIAKACEEADAGRAKRILALVPARVDTEWWARLQGRGMVHFIRGRIRFGGAAHNAPFPSALVQIHHKDVCWHSWTVMRLGRHLRGVRSPE